MEFRRGFINDLIEFYYTLNLSTVYSIDDALKLWSNRFQSRSHKNIEIFIGELIKYRKIDSETNSNKTKLSISIADYIKRIHRKVLNKYKNDVLDQTKCSRAKVSLIFQIKDSFEYLRKFKEDFNDIKKHRKKCSIDNVVYKKNKYFINKFINSRNKYSESDAKGFKNICDNLQQILNDGSSKLTCTKCSKIGDAVITLNCPKKFEINHIDNSFNYLCSIINKNNIKYPSEIELHKNRGNSQ